MQKIDMYGRFIVRHFRCGMLLNVYLFRNDVTNEARNKLLAVMFNKDTQITDWYLGIIDNLNFTELDLDDIYDDIDQSGNLWDEFKLYTDAANSDSTVTRPAWPTDVPASQLITNSVAAVFDVTGSGTIKGLFVVGGGTSPEDKGDHAVGSTLWSTALFAGGDATIQAGDQLEVTYTVGA